MVPCAELSAFIADRSAQVSAQRVMTRAATAWRECEDVAPVAKALRDYGEGSALEECAALFELMADPAKAEAFASGFLTAMTAAMAEQPLGHPCFWHSIEGDFTAVHLLHSGQATVSLVVVEADAGSPKTPVVSASFTATERHEIVLAGKAEGEIYSLENQSNLRRNNGRKVFEKGQVLHLPAWTVRVLQQVSAPLVSLRLSRRPQPMPVTKQVRLSDGAVLHEAAGEPVDTRHELMAALLGEMRHEEATPALAAFASRPGFSGARWEALRRTLALDTETGFRLLTRIADDPDDPLAADAYRLRGRLLESHPVLMNLVEG